MSRTPEIPLEIPVLSSADFGIEMMRINQKIWDQVLADVDGFDPELNAVVVDPLGPITVTQDGKGINMLPNLFERFGDVKGWLAQAEKNKAFGLQNLRPFPVNIESLGPVTFIVGDKAGQEV